jgi:hypothetical protein
MDSHGDDAGWGTHLTLPPELMIILPAETSGSE